MQEKQTRKKIEDSISMLAGITLVFSDLPIIPRRVSSNRIKLRSIGLAV
jgi:hypothetical protein